MGVRTWAKSYPHLRLSAILLFAFLCVGVVVSGAILTLLVRSEERSQLTRSVLSAQLLAKTIDPSLPNSEVQAALSSGFEFLERPIEVCYIQPRKPHAGKHEFLIAASAASQEAPRRSKWLENPTGEIRQVLASGQPSGQVDLLDDSSRMVVYVPIVGVDGHAKAVLMVAQSSNPWLASVDSTRSLTIMAPVLLVILSILFTSVLTRQIATSAGQTVWAKSLTAITKKIQTVVGEILLITLSVCILGLAAYSAINEYQSSIRIRGLQAKIDRLYDFKGIVAAEQASGASIESAAAKARGLGLGTYVSKMEKGPSEPVAWDRINLRLEAAISNLRAQRDASGKLQVGQRWIETTSMLLVVLLGVSALVLIRTASAQQQELKSAQLDSMRHQGAYRQVAENLPIGLFAYKKGLLSYTNKVWDRLTNRFPFEERLEALTRSLHPEDIAQWKSAFEEGEKKLQPLDLRYRLTDSHNQTRYMESKAVPILDPDGNLEHMLGFALDITDIVHAHQELEMKNAEVLAKNSQLVKALTDIEDNFEAMVASLVKAVEAKDPYTAGHSERVMGYSVRIGEVLNLSNNQLRILERGTLIHDIGKIGIPDAILTKPSALTDEEFALIKQHPMIGFRMIQGIPIFHECIPIVLWHHERMDGKGYPDRLAGSQIPILVRIATVADCFDAMTSNRAYRKGMDADRAISLLRQDAINGILDGEIVEALNKVVSRDGLLWRDNKGKAA